MRTLFPSGVRFLKTKYKPKILVSEITRLKTISKNDLLGMLKQDSRETYMLLHRERKRTTIRLYCGYPEAFSVVQ